MFESGQNWELFGYDMRQLGRHFISAWRDLLWAYDSPVRSRLDEAVSLRTAQGEQIYHAGKAVADIPAACSAVLLPEEQALVRRLRLPLAVEADLESALSLEVSANSPFTADDTGYGWVIAGRDEQHLQLNLVIVSLSAAMAYIGQHYNSHDAHAQEVWVDVDGQMVVIRGFGEAQRERYYRRRLLRVGAMLALAAFLVLLTVGVGAGFKKLELGRLENIASVTQREADDASRLRSALGVANETISAVNGISALYPDAHLELARLTRLVGDSAYVERLGISAEEIDLRGRAVDAAAIMELLTRQSDYAGVIAASPIRKIPGTQVEQFHLKIQLRGNAL
jgi:hypothetical protein